MRSTTHGSSRSPSSSKETRDVPRGGIGPWTVKEASSPQHSRGVRNSSPSSARRKPPPSPVPSSKKGRSSSTASVRSSSAGGTGVVLQQNEFLQELVEELEKKLEDARRENDELSKQLVTANTLTATHRVDKQKHVERAAAKEKELDDLKAVMEKKEKEWDMKDKEWEAVTERLRQEIITVLQKWQQSEDDIRRTQEELGRSRRAELKTLQATSQKHVSQYQQEVQTLKSKMQLLQEQISNRDGLLEQARKNEAAAVKDLGAMHKAMEELRSEVDRYKNALNLAHSAQQSREQDFAAQREIEGKLRNALEAEYQGKLNDLQKQLDRSDLEIQRQLRRFKDLKARYLAKQKSHTELKVTLGNAHQEVIDLKGKVSTLEALVSHQQQALRQRSLPLEGWTESEEATERLLLPGPPSPSWKQAVSPRSSNHGSIPRQHSEWQRVDLIESDGTRTQRWVRVPDAFLPPSPAHRRRRRSSEPRSSSLPRHSATFCSTVQATVPPLKLLDNGPAPGRPLALDAPATDYSFRERPPARFPFEESQRRYLAIRHPTPSSTTRSRSAPPVHDTSPASPTPAGTSPSPAPPTTHPTPPSIPIPPSPPPPTKLPPSPPSVQPPSPPQPTQPLPSVVAPLQGTLVSPMHPPERKSPVSPHPVPCLRHAHDDEASESPVQRNVSFQYRDEPREASEDREAISSHHSNRRMSSGVSEGDDATSVNFYTESEHQRRTSDTESITFYAADDTHTARSSPPQRPRKGSAVEDVDELSLDSSD